MPKLISGRESNAFTEARYSAFFAIRCENVYSPRNPKSVIFLSIEKKSLDFSKCPCGLVGSFVRSDASRPRTPDVTKKAGSSVVTLSTHETASVTVVASLRDTSCISPNAEAVPRVRWVLRLAKGTANMHLPRKYRVCVTAVSGSVSPLVRYILKRV